MSKLIENAVNLDWGMIMSTLIIRFVGVFIVLAVVMIGMIVLGKVVSALVSRQEAREAEEQEPKPSAVALAEKPEREAGEEEVVAAIGAALALAIELEQKAIVIPAHGGIIAGSWAMAGRVAQIGARLQGGAQRRT